MGKTTTKSTSAQYHRSHDFDFTHRTTYYHISTMNSLLDARGGPSSTRLVPLMVFLDYELVAFLLITFIVNRVFRRPPLPERVRLSSTTLQSTPPPPSMLSVGSWVVIREVDVPVRCLRPCSG